MRLRMSRLIKRVAGFTFPEVIIALAFFAILISIVTINLLGSRKQIAQGANIDVMVADIKEQQAKAMSGEGTTATDYGVFLEADKYTLFDGSVYNVGAGTNFVVNIDPSVSITNIVFPDSVIVFTKGSGEILNFVAGQNSFKLGSKTITVNKYGVVAIQ